MFDFAIRAKLFFRGWVDAPVSSARLRAAFLAIFVVVLVGIGLKYAAKVAKPGGTGEQTRSAFLRWRSQIHDIFQGVNVYQTHQYPNPPVMAMILSPFADLPPVIGAMAWFYTKIAMAIVAILWAFRLTAAPPGGTIPNGAKLLAIGLTMPALLGDLSHNNVNIFILFLVAGTLEAFRAKRDGLAGLLLALSIACKVTPLMFIPYFAWKRAWRLLASCVAGLILWLAIVPGAAFGWERNQELKDWYEVMVRPSVVDNRVTSDHPNQSLPGAIYRLCTHNPSFVDYPDGTWTPAAYHNVADIGTDAARWVVKGLLGVFALAVVLLCRWPVAARSSVRQGWPIAAELSLILLGMLLFSERTWKHHAVTLLLPFTVLGYALFVPELGRVRTYIGWALITVGLLTIVPGSLPSHAGDMALVYGSHTAAFLLLTAAICVLLSRVRWGPEFDSRREERVAR